jgi:alginate O-acetyltransferase complex protein AlgI
MLFNSLAFALFLPIALVVYWAAHQRLRVQNFVILVLSCIFYGFWDWRFLFLLGASMVLDYFVARGIARAGTQRAKRLLLSISVTGQLSLLGFFKYFDFFVKSLIRLTESAGLHVNLTTLNIILPVGISFYTFQTMSYTIDVYRGKVAPTKDFIAFGAFVSFFPQLVAGPIERGARLLPQMLAPRRLRAEDIEHGLWLVLLGFFRKSVLADNMALVVERIYQHPAHVGIASLLVGTVAFAIQIYCDFSGYSDIARGVAKWFGIDLMVNFRAPYASLNIQDFWRRWHISLSSWLRDYLYIPLGGNARGSRRTYVNLMTTMLLGGLWHGAAWNFVFWGGWQGIGLVFHRFFFRSRSLAERVSARLGPAVMATSWLLTFAFVLQSWVFFRVHGLRNVVVLSKQWFNWQTPCVFTGAQVTAVAGFFAVMCALDAFESRNYQNPGPVRLGVVSRGCFAGVLAALILAFGAFRQTPFLYFQF